MIWALLLSVATLQTPDLKVRVRDRTGHLVRSRSRVCLFLRMAGYVAPGASCRVPEGMRVDHLVPLAVGGADIPSNMTLLTIEEHAAKSKWERESGGRSWSDGTFTRMIQEGIDRRSRLRLPTPDPDSGSVVVRPTQPRRNVDRDTSATVDVTTATRGAVADSEFGGALAAQARLVPCAGHWLPAFRTETRSHLPNTLSAPTVVVLRPCGWWMATLAPSSYASGVQNAHESAGNVLSVGDKFKMGDVDARSVATEVVQFEPLRHRTILADPGGAMGQGCAAGESGDAVAAAVLGFRPELTRFHVGTVPLACGVSGPNRWQVGR